MDNNKKVVRSNNALLLAILLVILLSVGIIVILFFYNKSKINYNDDTTTTTTTEISTSSTEIATTTTETTTKIIESKRAKAKKISLQKIYKEEELYQPKCFDYLYIFDNKDLYGRLSTEDDGSFFCDYDGDLYNIDGKYYAFINSNVNNIYIISVYGDDIFYSDMNNQLYFINQNDRKVFGSIKMGNKTKIKDVYEIGVGTSSHFMAVDIYNRAVAVDNELYYSRKHNVTKTVVGNDVYEMKYTGTKKKKYYDEDDILYDAYYFDIIKNGKTIKKSLEFFYPEVDIDTGTIIISCLADNREGHKNTDECIKKYE